jgi:hypothetical protein
MGSPRIVSRAVCLVLLVAALAAAWPARSGDPDRRESIVAVIRSQLDAIGHDDGAAAFSHAAPEIRQMFRSADNFMAMVKGDYGVLYRPRAVTFLELTDLAAQGGLVQRVLVTGSDGSEAVALYSIRRLDDGTWRISGCVLVPVPGKST